VVGSYDSPGQTFYFESWKICTCYQLIVSRGGQSYLKMNGDEALIDESLYKSNGDEALNDDPL
jgi:hypothetical protein